MLSIGHVNSRNQNITAGYQGDYAEKEEVGSTNSFELRLYDARIGRWMTTDPAGQYHSPYLGMGNNWVNQVDPDGGFSDPPGTEPLVDALSEVGIPMPRDFKPGWYGGYGNGDSVYNRGPIGSGNSLLNIIVNFKPSFEMPTRVKMISEGAIQRGVSARGMGDSSGQARIDFSLRYDKKLKYKQSRPINLNDSYTDCSEWCYTVLKYVNPNIANKLLELGEGNVNITILKEYINSNGGFRKSSPKTGDIIMWGGHVEFVKEVTVNDHFTVHGAGGNKNSPVPRTQGKSKKGYIWLSPSYKKIDQFGAGDFLGFWTPR